MAKLVGLGMIERLETRAVKNVRGDGNGQRRTAPQERSLMSPTMIRRWLLGSARERRTVIVFYCFCPLRKKRDPIFHGNCAVH